MATNDTNTSTLKKPFNNKSRAEWTAFNDDFIEHLTLTKNKLHTVVAAHHPNFATVRLQAKMKVTKLGQSMMSPNPW